MTARQDHWDRVYATKGEGDVSWFQERPAQSLALIQATGVPKHGALIDIGGGASRLIDALIDGGYTDTTVLDISPTAIALAQQRLGRFQESVDWIAADITAWRPPRHYTLWHDRAVFHFLTEEDDRVAYRAALKHAVLPGGHVIVAAFGPDGPQTCSGLPVVRYGRPEIETAFAGLLSLTETVAEDHVTPTGAHQAFQFFRFAREVD
ncbi:MAG: class I SAM-dependent methyltransferase [Alphaproteobacteria bacterium]|nr:class I SAM-dependent methyltransferase [Alphaproteobacteria bacterium]